MSDNLARDWAKPTCTSQRILRLFNMALCLMAAAATTAAAQDLRPGPGADTLAKTCQNCHGLNTITAERHDLDGWSAIIARMIGNGAIMSDEDANKIANYLATNYGPDQTSGTVPPSPSHPVPPAPQ